MGVTVAKRPWNKKWDDAKLAKLVAESGTYREVFNKLGRTLSGAGYDSLRKHVKRLGLDTSHFRRTGFASNFDSPKLEIESYLKKDGPRIANQTLKKKLLEQGIWEKDCCMVCGITNEWNGKPLTLQVDHINGDRKDNTLANLRIICPNCHTQTPTYSGRNMDRFCACGKKIGRKSKNCRRCAAKLRENPTKIEWPPLEDLVEMVKSSNYVQVGLALGVSDNAVRKRVKTRSAKIEGR